MIKELKWLFSLLSSYKWQSILGSALVALTILFNIGLLSTAAVLLSRASFRPPILWLMTLIVGVRFFGIGRAVLRYSERLINHTIAFDILGKLRAEVYALIEPLVPDPLEKDYDKAKLYNRITNHIDVLQYFYLRVITVPLGAIFIGVIVASILFCYSWLNGVLFLSLYFLLVLLMPYILKKLMNGYGKVSHRLKDKLAIEFFDFYVGRMDYLLAGKAQGKINNLMTLFDKSLDNHQKNEMIEFWSTRLIMIISHLSLLVALYMNVDLVYDKVLLPELYPMLALMTFSAFEGVSAIPVASKSLDLSLSAAKELSELKKYQPITNYGREPIVNFDIVFDEVSFSYTDENFMENISIDIPAGKKIAFVGLSGSGKSTFAKLIGNLWHPTSGSRFIGGKPYAEVENKAFLKTVAVLEQKPYIFNATIKENLLIGNEYASDDELWAALILVGLADKVKTLAKGLNEPLDELGKGFSGGENERLALARLILRNPDVLILDEPYHGLDERTKYFVHKSLFKWAKEKTIILITHEFLGLETFDDIYVFENGKIIEHGTHQALIAKNGSYQKFYELEKMRV